MPRPLFALLLAAHPALAASLKTDVIVSTKTATPPPISWHLNDGKSKPANGLRVGTSDGPTIGVSGGLSEGKPFEMSVWAAGGAVAGSLAGPFGAAVGAGAGALLGLAYSVFVVPHNGDAKPKPR